MYIHNDFMSYGQLEVIENILLDMAKGIFPSTQTILTFPRAIYAFRRWEALILLLVEDLFAWTSIDDGQRISDIIRVIGACSVTILRQLFPPAFFQPIETFDREQLKKISDRLLNFKSILEQAIHLGHQLGEIRGYSSAFTHILQVVYCNWLWLVENTRWDLKANKPGLIEGSQFDESFEFIKELNDYQNQYSELGGDAHDLRQWSASRRDLFSFDRIEQDDYQRNFWFQM